MVDYLQCGYKVPSMAQKRDMHAMNFQALEHSQLKVNLIFSEGKGWLKLERGQLHCDAHYNNTF